MTTTPRIAWFLLALALPRLASAAQAGGAEDVRLLQQARAGAWRPAPAGSSSPAAPLAWRVDTDGVSIVRARAPGRAAPLAIRAIDPLTGCDLALVAEPPVRQRDRLLLRAATSDRALAIEVVLDPHADRMDIAGLVTNRGAERPLHVRLDLALDATGWRWWDALRAARVIDARMRYATTTPVPAGLRGAMSTYPFSCLASDAEALSFALPLRHPRVFEIAYEGPRRAYGIGFDMALSPDMRRAPNQATFFCALYAPDPAWGLRAAAQAYYDLYPEDFARRTDRDGSWMPFTRIGTVRDADDFRFAFHEYGSVDLPYNAERGIYSFRYEEPWTYWMKMDAGQARDAGTAFTQLLAHAEGADPWNRDMARATVASAIADADGQYLHQFVNEPWCSGTLFFNNSNPALPAPKPGYTNMGELNLGIARADILGPRPRQALAWEAFGDGYTVVDGAAGDTRGRTLRLEKIRDGQVAGAVQTVVLDQQEPRALLLRASGRAAQVTGAADDDFALYADVQYADGTFLWRQVAPFDTGTHDWQERRLTIAPEKPVKLIKMLALLRGNHRGTAWIDDMSLAEARPGTTNAGPELARNGAFEQVVAPGRVDGMYLDSMEGWAKRLNFRREHFRWAEVPLTYETGSGKPAILNAFSIFEFTSAMADFLHANDRLLMANWVLIDFPFYAALLDVPGREVNWLDAEGRFAPDADSAMGYRRVLSRHKPYPLLLNVQFDRFTPQMMSWYFQRCLLYATAPGMFSHDAATNPYFENPVMYNRDRPLFMRYMPVLQQLSRAGWEPITFARADTPLLVERYGTNTGSGLFLVVHNDAAQPATGELTPDRAALGAPEAWLWDVLAGRRRDVAANGSVRLALQPYESVVFRLLTDKPEDLAAWSRDALTELAGTAAAQARMGRLTAETAAAFDDRLLAASRRLGEGADLAGAADAARAVGDVLRAAETLAAPDLLWRAEEAQNAVSTMEATLSGLDVAIVAPSDLVSPSRASFAVTLRNSGAHALALESLSVTAGTNDPVLIKAPDAAQALAPGASRTLSVGLAVPPGLPDASRWPIRMTLAGSVGPAASAEVFHVTRSLACRIVPPVSLSLDPPLARTFGAPVSFNLRVRNQGASGISAVLRLTGAGPLSWSKRELTLGAGADTAVAVEARPPSGPARRDLTLEAHLEEDGVRLATATSRLTVYPPSRSLLARDGVVVTVDSTFAGYRPDAIHDGVTDTRGLTWSEAAWASAEVASPHWVEALFPSPERVSCVVLHWAEDQGRLMGSRCHRVEIEEDGAWVAPMARVTQEDGGRRTRYVFPPVTAGGIRVWQDPGCGPAARPDLLWLAEVEALDETAAEPTNMAR